ncbi:MAG: nitroreductase family protein [Aeriscardovia sp.]|nr:nitroreductase family protein [Aeriscardovia sp.]
MTDFEAGQDFLSTLKGRRSIYHLGKADVKDEEIESYLREIFSSVPSSFNARAQRVLLLLGNENMLFWRDLVPGALKERYENNPGDEEVLAKRRGLCDSFSKGNGTILFFSDSKIGSALKGTFKEYEPAIDRFLAQEVGMDEYAMWLGLSKIGMGASLQHFLGLETAVRAAYDINPDWVLDAQMPFGSIEKAPAAKDTAQAPEHFRVIG